MSLRSAAGARWTMVFVKHGFFLDRKQKKVHLIPHVEHMIAWAFCSYSSKSVLRHGGKARRRSEDLQKLHLHKRTTSASHTLITGYRCSYTVSTLVEMFLITTDTHMSTRTHSHSLKCCYFHLSSELINAEVRLSTYSLLFGSTDFCTEPCSQQSAVESLLPRTVEAT